MNSGQPTSCSVEGAQYFLADSDGGAETICERFSEDFYAALGERELAESFEFALSVTKDGTISARISSESQSVARTYPEVSVDVMDRGLDYRDVSQLANAAAQIVKTNQTSA